MAFNLNTLAITGQQRSAVAAFKADLTREVALRRDVVLDSELAALYALSPMVYAATEFWGSNVENVPFRAYTEEGEALEDETHPLVQLLGDRNFNYQMGRTERTMRIWGYSMSRKRKNLYGEVVSLEWVNPLLYVLDRRGMGMTLDGFRVFSGRGQEISESYIRRRDATFFHEFSFYDDYDGISSAEACFRAAATEPEMQTMMLALFRNMAVPLSIVMPEKDQGLVQDAQAEINRLKLFIRTIFGGARNFGRTFVTALRLQWQNITIPFKDMELSLHYQPMREAVAQAFDVKLSFFTTGEARHDELEAQIQLWYRQSLAPRCEKYGVALTEQLCSGFPGIIIKPDLSGILTEDNAAKLDNIERQQRLSLISLADSQVANGQEPDAAFAGLYWYEGVGWVPKTEFATVWKNVTAAPPMSTGFGFSDDTVESAASRLALPASRAAEYIPDDVFAEMKVAASKAFKRQTFEPRAITGELWEAMQTMAADGKSKDDILAAAKAEYTGTPVARKNAVEDPEALAELVSVWEQLGLTKLVNEATDDAESTPAERT